MPRSETGATTTDQLDDAINVPIESLPGGNNEKSFTLSPSKDDEEPSLLSMEGPSVVDGLSTRQHIAFIAIICSAQFLNMSGLGQTLGVMQLIGDAFGMNSDQFPWLVAGYSLTAGTFVLVAGRMGDCFGYKPLFLGGMVWFSLWSVISGLSVYASSGTMFIIARTLQGIGPAVLLPNALAILGVSCRAGIQKNMAFALFGASSPLGGVGGYLVAGLFNLAWWPWAFWSTGIIQAVLVVVGIFAIPRLPKSPDQSNNMNKSLQEKIEQLDVWGSVSGVAALVLINFAWNQGSSVGWKQPYIAVTLALGLIFAAVFFVIERWFAKVPLIPFTAFTGNVPLVVSCIACGWACFGIWVFYISEFFLVLRGTSPILLAACMSPLAIVGLLASVVVGALLHRIPVSWIMTFSLTCFMIGTVLLATTPVEQTYWAQLFVGMLIIPWGMETSFPTATVLISNTMKSEQQGMGASLVATIVNYSISLGLGVGATVQLYVAHRSEEQDQLLHGYRAALWTGVGFAGVGVILSLLMIARSSHSTSKSLDSAAITDSGR
ncbi:major facilitator superfamily domain-containing protein [Penicillium macrosclerotiorum]|uniref:major facilitator superfamily domain-containing protein n=1 Tax=Penicillium macrosclerotiorum TaxID=303699 RepID=UPI002548AA49|nr:major facilitator superfamily domain-containing protein [Penicillium macrosclerotiorum]KAJ5673960.1 major facilitator superfamily domain-containing protein [Penicillium macrosclerotiorum]